ncbi:MAG: hypothetical protein JWM41_4968 [Gemmatimonadetes bacterium]|nr:hypothetical protein [Gemmatimonadota bacterium]
MNDFNDPHTPTPEFLASLKHEVRRAYRADRQFETPRSARARRLGLVMGIAAGAVVTLTIGLVLGASTGYASAEVLDARQREVAATNLATKRQLAQLRLDLARSNYETVRHEVDAGSATPASLQLAKAEVDSMEANVSRVEFDLEANGANAPATPSGFTILRAFPMRTAIAALTCGAASLAPQSAPAQQGIPVVSLATTAARTATTLGAVLGVRELPGGRLLVNDAGRRQIRIYDSTLANATVPIDSAAGSSSSYFATPSTITPYLADSTLFSNNAESTVLVLDRNGQVARALALPTFQDGVTPFARNFPMPHAADSKGRLLTESGFSVRGDPVTHVARVADSTLILRADLDSRQVDVIGAKHTAGSANRSDPPENGKRVVTSIIQPVPTEDSWSVLSDGTVAFVRGRDYHVDWIFPDGTKSSTEKLAFDWKRLTDEDKQKLVDSARVVYDSLMSIRNKRYAGPTTPNRADVGSDAAGRARSGGGADPASGQQGSIQRMEFVPLSEIPDYYPPIHRNASMPDADGNLWILPTTSAQSQHGELVYDVVNPKKGLFERVRMPLGRSIAGFGKGGVVYLQAGDRTNGFYLERAKIQK